MSGARTAGGLICSHGSDLDTRIPRAKMPKSALPQSLRIKLGFEKKNPRSYYLIEELNTQLENLK